MTVRFAQESLSAFSRNWCPFSARTAVRFQQEYALGADIARAIAPVEMKMITIYATNGLTAISVDNGAQIIARAAIARFVLVRKNSVSFEGSDTLPSVLYNTL